MAVNDDDAPAENPPPAPPVDNQALANALQAIANALANLGPPAAPAAPAHQPVLDPYSSTAPFDLSSRAGSTAFSAACAALDDTWDGTIETFPSFIIGLRIRASEIHWNSAQPQGILTIAGHHLITHYHSITDAEIEAARVARVDPRAVQNSRSLYKCLKSSISGDLRATIFDQVGNLPITDDGPTLFKKLTTFTMVASLQLSMISFKNILQFEPVEHKFNIPTINTKLNHLFVLATTRERQLLDSERIQHTLMIYSKIKQPEPWAMWVRIQVDKFDEGLIHVCQDFMNQATLKFNKITSTEGGFQGSNSTVQEDIVAMFTAAKRKRLPTSAPTDVKPKDANDKPFSKKLPPFAKHFKANNDPDSQKFKVGDSKLWNDLTWYFCDCPTHRDKLKWHTHTAETCRTRQNWLENKGGRPAGRPAANPGIADDADDDPTANVADAPDIGHDITTLLANAMNLTGDNNAAKELIAEALNAIHHI
jgi:hypothetical protein